MKKRLLSITICAILALTLILPVVQASAVQPLDHGSRDVVMLPDGSYIITEIHEESGSAFRASSEKTKNGSKTSTVYSATGNKLYSITVHGSFTYNGSTASAESSSYSYTVDSALWSFSSGYSSCSGATARASGTFQSVLQSKTQTVSLTCSATGTLS